jgi:hypothetical protein
MVKHEECVKSHHTNRPNRIYWDGTIGYELICDKYGTVTEDETPPDMRVHVRYRSLLKPGVLVSVSGNDVVAVWPNQKAALPTHILGMPVR